MMPSWRSLSFGFAYSLNRCCDSVRYGLNWNMDLQNTVNEALNAMYHHPDDAVRMQADRYLQDFQRTLDAWQVADKLLHDSNSNLETLIVCSQTLRSKVAIVLLLFLDVVTAAANE